ncbi:unnamed protein product [Mytilus coruscus]|uniref:CCHC-type domain-containing protein n=1 Tax=Mytilus coruscus TaxID=42192 RepID=A0A6J8AF12_MYTCO|nr:unnamed protein product [Mytilus coruscus]
MDPTKILAKFKGDFTENPSRWWKLFENFVNLYWDESKFCNAFPLFLEENAQIWFNGLPEDVTDTQLSKLSDFINLKQQETESVAEYINRVNALSEDQDVGQFKLTKLQYKCKPELVRLMSLGKWPETVEEAEVSLRSVEANFHYLEKCEKKETEDKIISELKPKIDMMFQQISAVNSKSLQQPTASPTMVEPLHDDRKAKVQHRTRTPRRQRRRNPCYRCGECDHIPSQCRFIRIKCNKCKSIGHKAKMCRSKQNKFSAQPTKFISATGLSNTKATNLIKIRVANHFGMAMVDSGATVSAISADFYYANLKKTVPLEKAYLLATGASGASLRAVGQIHVTIEIKLDPETKHKTAFTCHEGVFEFNRLPFGLSNSPHTFQLVMSEALRGINWKSALVYMDDVLIFSKTFEEHLHHLTILFQKLREVNLKLKPTKCTFAAKEVKFLGHVLSKDGIAVDTIEIDAVKTFPVPQNITDGTANGNADALSRRPYGTEIVTITTATVESSTQTEATFIELDPYASICEITTSPKEKVVNDQRTDENFKDVIKYILDKELPDKTRQARKTVIESQDYILDDDPGTIRIKVKNVPLSADDGQIHRALTLQGCNIQAFSRERLRIDGKVTNCETGDRLVISQPEFQGRPNLVSYEGVKKCHKCLKPGHVMYNCPNDWVCRICNISGHKMIDCPTELQTHNGMEQEVNDKHEETNTEQVINENSKDDEHTEVNEDEPVTEKQSKTKEKHNTGKLGSKKSGMKTNDDNAGRSQQSIDKFMRTPNNQRGLGSRTHSHTPPTPPEALHDRTNDSHGPKKAKAK